MPVSGADQQVRPYFALLFDADAAVSPLNELARAIFSPCCAVSRAKQSSSVQKADHFVHCILWVRANKPMIAHWVRFGQRGLGEARQLRADENQPSALCRPVALSVSTVKSTGGCGLV